MTTRVLEVETFQPVPLAEVPDGEYYGTWGAYYAEVTIDGKRHRFRTENGIRTMNAPCVITVRDGQATVRAGDAPR